MDTVIPDSPEEKWNTRVCLSLPRLGSLSFISNTYFWVSCAGKWLPFGAFSLDFVNLVVQVSLSKGTLPKFSSQSVAQGKAC